MSRLGLSGLAANASLAQVISQRISAPASRWVARPAICAISRATSAVLSSGSVRLSMLSWHCAA